MVDNDVVDDMIAKVAREQTEILRQMLLRMTAEERANLDILKLFGMIVSGALDKLKREGVK